MAKKEEKAQSAKLQILDMGGGKLGHWIFLLGVLVAILAGFIAIPYLTVILVIAGFVVGILNIREAEVQGFLLASVAIMVVGSAGLQVLAGIGPYVESILKNIVMLVAPAALVLTPKIHACLKTSTLFSSKLTQFN